eukprot:GILK01009252.1.p1 GENE.GILK01009252.1~~GILK01009252.1.p1  ORF type:complete len:562 (-),score=82.47 GILK01009252.1:61-1746(-)
MKEILTLQFGTYANYVGSHFWNLQDELFNPMYMNQESPEIAQDILFRFTDTQHGPVCHPRVVMFETKGGMGSVTASSLNPVDREAPFDHWRGRVQRVEADTVPKSKYLEYLDDQEEQQGQPAPASSAQPEAPALPDFALDDTVQYWTDYAKYRLHPRNVVELPGIHHDLTPFDLFPHGGSLFDSASMDDTMLENVRWMLEECENISGVHAIVDIDSGFSGVAARVLEWAHDEIPKHPLVTFGVMPHSLREPSPLLQEESRSRRVVNQALSYHSLLSVSSLFVPLSSSHLMPESFPGLHLQPSKPFHSSALFAAAIDTATMPYRMSSSALGEMTYFTSLLTSQPEMNVAALSCCLPFPLPRATSLQSFLQNAEGVHLVDWFTPLMPGFRKARLTFPLVQSIMCRGLPNSARVVTDVNGHATMGKDFSGVWDEYLARVPAAHTNRVVSDVPLPVPVPFPHFFSSRISHAGELLPETEFRGNGEDVVSCPMATQLQVSSAMSPHFEELQKAMKSVQRRTKLQFEKEGIRVDDFLNADTTLDSLVAAYGSQSYEDFSMEPEDDDK